MSLQLLMFFVVAFFFYTAATFLGFKARPGSWGKGGGGGTRGGGDLVLSFLGHIHCVIAGETVHTRGP